MANIAFPCMAVMYCALLSCVSRASTGLSMLCVMWEAGRGGCAGSWLSCPPQQCGRATGRTSSLRFQGTPRDLGPPLQVPGVCGRAMHCGRAPHAMRNVRLPLCVVSSAPPPPLLLQSWLPPAVSWKWERTGTCLCSNLQAKRRDLTERKCRRGVVYSGGTSIFRCLQQSTTPPPPLPHCESNTKVPKFDGNIRCCANGGFPFDYMYILLP